MKNNIPIRVGLITGVLSATFVQLAFALFDLLNCSLGLGLPLSLIRGIVGLFSIAFLGIGIYTGMTRVKTGNGGTLSWGKAVVTGLIIALLTALLSALGAVVFNLLHPDFHQKMLEEISANTSSGGAADAFSPAMMVMQAFMGQLMGGAVISLVMAFFLRKK